MNFLNKTIFLAGCDGTGKTTQSKKLKSFLNSKGYSVSIEHLRYPRISTKFITFFSRITGITSYHKVGDKTLRYRQVSKSLILSKIYPPLLLLDFFLISIFLDWKNRKFDFLIFERYSLDVLVDLLIETKKGQPLKKRKFLKDCSSYLSSAIENDKNVKSTIENIFTEYYYLQMEIY